jgi:transglutaminase-like putative cysteine protease
MQRRDVLLRLGSVLPAAVLGGRAAALPAGWRSFEITTRVKMRQPQDHIVQGRRVVWLPLPSAQPGYQQVLASQHDAPGARAALLAAPGGDARVLRVEWPDPTAVRPLLLQHTVATRDRSVSPEGGGAAPAESAEVLESYLRPTRFQPTDGIVKDLALRITAGRSGDVAQARALYEWVVQSTRREPTVRGCGLGDVVSLLKSGDFRGKCADINGLFVALARSAGIPARDVYGIRVADSRRGFKSLGKSDDITRAQHCRAEFHAAGRGWVPVDPADVRKVMLEEVPGGLPFEDPKVQAAYKALFGSWEMNWIAYNHAADVALPGSKADPLPFLMYPQGENADGLLDCLDPADFHYEIHSREITP